MIYFHIFMLCVYAALAVSLFNSMAYKEEDTCYDYSYDEFDDIDCVPIALILFVLAVLVHIGVTWYNW